MPWGIPGQHHLRPTHHQRQQPASWRDPQRYGAVLLTAVWMYLDRSPRAQAMPVIANLLRPGGVVLFSVRHGPVPAGRVLDEIPAEEPIALAAGSGLRLLLQLEDQPGAYGDTHQTQGTWTRLVFTKG